MARSTVAQGRNYIGRMGLASPEAAAAFAQLKSEPDSRVRDQAAVLFPYQKRLLPGLFPSIHRLDEDLLHPKKSHSCTAKSGDWLENCRWLGISVLQYRNELGAYLTHRNTFQSELVRGNIRAATHSLAMIQNACGHSFWLEDATALLHAAEYLHELSTETASTEVVLPTLTIDGIRRVYASKHNPFIPTELHRAQVEQMLSPTHRREDGNVTSAGHIDAPTQALLRFFLLSTTTCTRSSIADIAASAPHLSVIDAYEAWLFIIRSLATTDWNDLLALWQRTSLDLRLLRHLDPRINHLFMLLDEREVFGLLDPAIMCMDDAYVLGSHSECVARALDLLDADPLCWPALERLARIRTRYGPRTDEHGTTCDHLSTLQCHVVEVLAKLYSEPFAHANLMRVTRLAWNLSSTDLGVALGSIARAVGTPTAPFLAPRLTLFATPRASLRALLMTDLHTLLERVAPRVTEAATVHPSAMLALLSLNRNQSAVPITPDIRAAKYSALYFIRTRQFDSAIVALRDVWGDSRDYSLDRYEAAMQLWQIATLAHRPSLAIDIAVKYWLRYHSLPPFMDVASILRCEMDSGFRQCRTANWVLASYICFIDQQSKPMSGFVAHFLQAYLDHWRVSKPSDLEAIDDEGLVLESMLVHICRVDVLSFLSPLISPAIATAECARLLARLRHSSLQSVRIEAEAKHHSLIREQALPKPVGLGSGRVVVDLASIRRRWVEIYSEVRFAMLQELGDPAELDLSSLSSQAGSLFNAIREQYLFDPVSGVAASVSRKIRHGALPGELRRSFEQAGLLLTAGGLSWDGGLVPWLNSVSQSLQPESRSALSRAVDHVATSVERGIDLVMTRGVHIRAPEDHADGWIDVPCANRGQVASLVRTVRRSDDVSQVIDAVLEELDRSLDQALDMCRTRLTDALLNDFVDPSLLVLRKTAEQHLRPSDADVMKAKLESCRASFTDSLVKVREWLRRVTPSSTHGVEGLHVLSAIEALWRDAASPEHKIGHIQAYMRTPIAGSMFEPLCDIGVILLTNAVTHGSSDGKGVTMELRQEGEHLVLSVQSQCVSEIECDFHERRIRERLESPHVDIHRAFNTEGGTGLRKMLGLLRSVGMRDSRGRARCRRHSKTMIVVEVVFDGRWKAESGTSRPNS